MNRGAGWLGNGRSGAALALSGVLLALQALATDPPAAVPDAVPAQPPGISQVTDVFEVERLLDADGMVERRLVPAADLVVGDELRYVIRLRNEGPSRIEPGRIQVRIPVPDGVRFLPGSAGGAGTLVEYAPDGLTFSAHLPDQPVAADTGAADTGAADTVAADTGAAPTGSTPQIPGVPETPTAAATADAPSAEAGRPADADIGQELTIRWTYQQPLDPGAVVEVFFHVRLL
jgi:uncharacterized repeat protein (TIGR01451 family)